MSDLISRQAAIDAAALSAAEWDGMYVQDINGRIREALEKLPSAQPEQRWIPCGERLPEDNSDILVTYVEKDEKRIAPVNYGCGTWFDCLFDNVLDQVGVLAWMPLPEPYEAESEDKE